MVCVAFRIELPMILTIAAANLALDLFYDQFGSFESGALCENVVTETLPNAARPRKF